MTAPAVFLGTSGFSFDDWVGPVYPERLPKTQWLTFYEQSLGFNAVEVNYTYYQMPSVRTMEGLVRKTSPDFRFTVKTHRRLTHDILQPDRSIREDAAAFQEFRDGLRPMVDAGRLGCVLAQFPYAFTDTPPARGYLDRAMDRLGDLGLVIEFRHRSWVAPETFERLRRRQVGWCVVDEPQLSRLMPWTGEVTSGNAYVRFHGRNAAQWFGTSTAERYNYLYSDAELRGLAGKVADLAAPAKALYVFFNNCHAGAAAKNALQFQKIIGDVSRK
jgi:uncharacterized protein YecE (DUF72 family)